MSRRKKDAGSGSGLLIKRYSNRKLYNTGESRYITLDELADLIKAGEHIRVVDNDSGEDLTSVTLSQILLENERKKRDALPRSLLIDLIQRSDQLVDTVKKSISSGVGIITDAGGDLERTVRRLVSRGELAADDGEKLVKRLADWVKEGQSGIEGQIDQRIRKLTRRFDIPARDDVDRLRSSIDRLAESVERLEVKRRAGKKSARSAGGER
ncbi:MAG: polyhydroxyalkanoate synthesis regulator DNA-binding domain-containing protein [Myxococcota bacterium]